MRSWNVYMIGTLVSEEEISSLGKQSIFINNQNSLQFNIKLISQEPESFINNKYFTAYTSDIEECGFEDDVNLSEYQRINKLKEFLSKRLLIFKPIKKSEHYFIVSDVKTIIKPDKYQYKSTYIAVPLFEKKYYNKNFEEFCDDLKNGRFVGKIDGISNELGDTPPFIIWKDENSTKILGEFESHVYDFVGFKFNFNKLYYVEFKQNWYLDIFKSPEIDNILFIGSDTHLEMYENLTNGVCIDDINNNFKRESDFIDLFIEATKELNLIYDKIDLINFHTSMKSSNLVILSGMSGTGKSKLVQAYGKVLGLDDVQLNIIPVRPSWTDDGDLIGYVDLIHSIYKPGDSGLINTLVQASKSENMDKIYIICFDEMNLARVEHYFSQFLSVLEMEKENRKLRLYNDELEGRLYNSSHYPASINIGDNVMFVGTVNLDESTYHFSDKVLDRANVITLNTVPFSRLKEENKFKKQKFNEITLEQYNQFKSKEKQVELSDREIELLNKLHIEMNKVNKNMGIGFRIIKQLDMYLKNIPENCELARTQGFDLQILQRVLTKLRGSQEQLQELIGEYNSNEKCVEGSIIINILDEYKDVSDFKATKDYIIQKARELKIYGYTI